MVRNKFLHIWPPAEKRLEKSTCPPLEKFLQHQCGKQSKAGWQTVHCVFCQTITKSCQITNNTLETISTKYCENSATFFWLNDLLHHWTQYQLRYLNLWYLGKKVGGRPPRKIVGGAHAPPPSSATYALYHHLLWLCFREGHFPSVCVKSR